MTTKLATAAEKCQADWTAKFPRPSAESHEGSTAGLEFAQREWDDAEDLRQRLAAARQRMQAEAATREDPRAVARQREQDALERARQERREHQEAQLVAELRAGYFSIAGATEEGFTRDLPGLVRDLPGLLDERRRRAALAGNETARTSFARQYRG